MDCVSPVERARLAASETSSSCDDSAVNQVVSVDLLDEYIRKVDVSMVSGAARMKLDACKSSIRAKPKVTTLGDRTNLLTRFNELFAACSSCGLTSEQTLAEVLDASRGTALEMSARRLMRPARKAEWILLRFQSNLRGLRNEYGEQQIAERRDKIAIMRAGAEFTASAALNMMTTRYCVVDRTYYIPYFLQKECVLVLRPRRFGKSFWLYTLKCFFKNPESLADYSIFEMSFTVGGMDWNPLGLTGGGTHSFEPLPVLHFDFSRLAQDSASDMKDSLSMTLGRMAEEYGVDLSRSSSQWEDRLRYLILHLSRYRREQRVVVLVDEYDSILLNSSGSPEFDEILELHAAFYSLLKALGGAILFTCVVGISKWMLAKLGSGANHLRDLTFDPYICQLFGFTDSEVRVICEQHANKRGTPGDTQQYNRFVKFCSGYSFDGEDAKRKVYNPYFVACDLSTWDKTNHWYESGPSIVKYWSLIKGVDPNCTLTLHALRMADPDKDSSGAVFMMYMGYLTIKEVFRSHNPGEMVDTRVFKLGYPNSRIELAIAMDYFEIRGVPRFSGSPVFAELIAQSPPKIAEFFGIINFELESFRCQFQMPNDERYEFFHKSRLYCLFRRMPGVRTFAKIHSAQGKPDFILYATSTGQPRQPAIFQRPVRVVVEVKVALPKESPIDLAEDAWVQVLHCGCGADGQLDDYETYNVTVALRCGTSVVDCLMYRSGAYECYGAVDVENKCMLRVRYPARNRFFMNSLDGLLEAIYGLPNDVMEDVRMRLSDHGINALSLIELERSHLEEIGFDANSTIVAILGATKTVKPNKETLLDGRDTTPESWQDVAALGGAFFAKTQRAFLYRGDLSESLMGTRLAISALENLFGAQRVSVEMPEESESESKDAEPEIDDAGPAIEEGAQSEGLRLVRAARVTKRSVPPAESRGMATNLKKTKR